MPNQPTTPKPELPIARPVGAGPPLVTPPSLDAFAEARPADRLAVRQRKWVVAIDLLVVFGLFMVISVAVPALVQATPPPDSDEVPQLDVAVVAVTGCLTILVVVFVLAKNRQPLSTIGVGSRNLIVDVAVGLGACVFLFLLSFTMRLFLTLVDPSMFEVLTENFERLQRILPRMSPLTIVVTAAIVGVYEEVFFRGFLLPRLRRLCGSWLIAVLVASFFFAVLHAYQGGLGIITVFFLALTFSVVFVWRRSLLPVIIAHFLFDLVNLLFVRWLQEHPELLAAEAAAPGWIL